MGTTDRRKNPNNTATHRQCSRCKGVFDRSEFYPNKGKHDNSTSYCKTCMKAILRESYLKRREKVAARRAELKQVFVERLGGKCSRCGHADTLGSLDFHHCKGEKDGTISELITKASTGNKRYMKALEVEVSKCILLCRNCHAEVHHEMRQRLSAEFVDRQLQLGD